MDFRLVLRVFAGGPLDEFDDETNGDPDSTWGEDSEEGFDDDPFGAEPQFVPDDGLDGLAEDDDEEEADGEDDDDDE